MHGRPVTHPTTHLERHPRRGRRRRTAAVALSLGVAASATAIGTGPAAAQGRADVPRPAAGGLELRSQDLAAAGLADVAVADGVRLHTETFVAETALPAQDDLAPLFRPGAESYLATRPSYEEPIVVHDDRLVVDRRLSFELAPDACQDPTSRAELGALCFTIDRTAAVPPEVARSLEQVRAQLARGERSATVADGVTVQAALAMDDADLLDLILNQGERSIRRVSTVALPTGSSDAVTAGSPEVADPTMASAIEAGVTAGPGPIRPGAGSQWMGSLHPFGTKHFLTGFTLGRQIDDTWEYTIAESTWWHDRYYVKFDYELSIGFGIRAPFSVDVAYGSGDRDLTEVAVGVAPVDVDANGAPAFPAVGLDPGKYFAGDEFVLEAQVGCRFEMSIPGPDPSTRTCDGLPGIDESRDIDPVIGDEVSSIAAWWIPGSVTGLAFDVGVADVSLDLGVGADITNGRIGMRFDPMANTALPGMPAGVVWFDDRDTATVAVDRLSGTEDAGFTVSDPRYAFDVSLRPKVRLSAGIDLAIYENEWEWIWALDHLSINAGFELDHHDGTVDQHQYRMNWDQVVADPGTGGGGQADPAGAPSPRVHHSPRGGAVVATGPAAPADKPAPAPRVPVVRRGPVLAAR